MSSIQHGILVALYGLAAAVLTAAGTAVANYHLTSTNPLIQFAFSLIIPALAAAIGTLVHYFQTQQALGAKKPTVAK